MPVLLWLVVIAFGVSYWIIRANSTVRAAKNLNRDTKGLQRRVKHGLQDAIGTPLQRVRDPRLAAVILMIQMVRTAGPVTATEKTRIVELMDHPLQIENISDMFEKAWAYTEPRRPFSTAADQLMPLLRKSLDDDECMELLDMLRQVAGTDNEPSELQLEAIVRLKRRLLGSKVRVVS